MVVAKTTYGDYTLLTGSAIEVLGSLETDDVSRTALKWFGGTSAAMWCVY